MASRSQRRLHSPERSALRARQSHEEADARPVVPQSIVNDFYAGDAMHNAVPFPIVGIGASAGGVQALQAFFRGLPENPGMAFVVVTHMNPDRESMLAEILARHTSLPVIPANDCVQAAQDHVYVMPSDAILTIRDRTLIAGKIDRVSRERKPVDVFFASLAKDQGESAVAIILSGGDGDGTLGAKAIREAGGLTIAQASDGSSPQYPGMPETAITSGVIDLVLPVEDMGRRLVDIVRSLQGSGRTKDEQEQADLSAVYREVYALLAAHSGHDFSGYKTKTFLRRMQRRMQVRQQHSAAAYVELMKREPQEVASLFRDLLINVTNFFRDEQAFSALRQHVIPRLFEGKNASDAVRIWVPGCATGEEVYSIALLVREHMNTIEPVPKVTLFATDIDESALAVARAGRYPAPMPGKTVEV